MSGIKINKMIVKQSALRAFIYNLVLEGVLWAFILFAVSRHHLTAVLSYELLLHAVILLMLGIYGVTFIAFILGILTGLLVGGKGEEDEKENG